MRQMDTPDFNIVVNLFNLFLPKHLACIMSDAPKLWFKIFWPCIIELLNLLQKTDRMLSKTLHFIAFPQLP